MDNRLCPDTVCKNLNRRGFVSAVFDSPSEAADYALQKITVKETVGIGGSKTVEQLGLYDTLTQRGNTVFWHWKSTGERDARLDAMNADVYLCSVNAMTADGDLIDIDGWGNRPGAMVYGPKRAFIFVSTDKICTDYNAAIERIHTVACPQNARRLKLDVPCAKLGYCVDCAPEKRMCRVTTVYSYPRIGRETHVLLIKAPLGY